MANAGIKRWSGTQWQDIGGGLNIGSSGGVGVRALGALPGGGIVATGEFTIAGGIAANGIAHWDGTAWRSLGGGLVCPPSGGGNPEVGSGNSIAVLSPQGDVVVGGGCGGMPGAAPAPNLARYTFAGTGITQQPKTITAIVGATATFSVGAATFGATTYQWRRGGAALSNGGRVSGSNSASLTITDVVASDEASYDCVVTDACGSTTSTSCALNVSCAEPSRLETTPVHPSGRFLHSMAYDPSRGVVVLYGGSSSIGTALADTWEWNGSVWTLRMAQSPPGPRRSAAMAWDGVNIVMFGGYEDQNARYLSSFWRWDGSSWQLLPNGPSAREGHAMARGPGNTVVLYGGGNCCSTFSDTWVWNGTAWQFSAGTPSAGPKHNFSMAFDAVRNRTVLFGGDVGGGELSNETWEWDGLAWTRISAAFPPAARTYPVMWFDPAFDRIMMYGGNTGGADTRELFTWDGLSWSKDVALAPVGHDAGAGAYDASSEELVAFGGFDAPNGFGASTWTCSYSIPCSIVTQPNSTTICSYAQFPTYPVVSISCAGTSCSYQWQILSYGAWTDLVEGEVFASGRRVGYFLYPQGSSLSVLNLSVVGAPTIESFQVRCVVSDTCGGAIMSSSAAVTVCVADTDDGSGAGTCDGGVDISDLLYYLLLFDGGDLRADLDDGSSTGTPDGGVDISDLLYYLFRFEAGC